MIALSFISMLHSDAAPLAVVTASRQYHAAATLLAIHTEEPKYRYFFSFHFILIADLSCLPAAIY